LRDGKQPVQAGIMALWTKTYLGIPVDKEPKRLLVVTLPEKR